MTLVTNTEKGDFLDVLKLINHVFGKDNSPVKMEDIFTDLLCKENMAHMKIIKVDGKPVSVVNYIVNDVAINGSIIKAAQIGAVCTHEDHRRMGYSAMILKNCLNQMRTEGVDLLYVSGDIDLYTKNNIHIVGNMKHFKVEQNNIVLNQEDQEPTLAVKTCCLEDIDVLSTLYNKESVRFIRDKQRFLDLVKRTPGAAVFNREAKLFQIEVEETIQGYIICAVVLKDSSVFEMEVIEYAGKRSWVLLGIIEVMKQFNVTAISGYTPWFDADMIKTLEMSHIKMEACHYPGTMQIINFSQFMQKLMPLYLKEKRFENLEFYEVEGTYVFGLDHMELVVDNHKTLHNLVLGNDMENLKTVDIVGDDTLFDMLQLVLPIPVPNPYNLNFI